MISLSTQLGLIISIFISCFQSHLLAKDFQYVVEAQERTAPTVPKEIHLMADAAPAIRNGMDVAVQRRTPKRRAGVDVAPKKSRRRSGVAGKFHQDGLQNNNDDDEATSAGMTETSSTASCLLGGDDEDDEGEGAGGSGEFELLFGDCDDDHATKTSLLDDDVVPLAIASVKDSLDDEGEVLVSLTWRSSH